MPAIQTRVFRRFVPDSSAGLEQAIVAVTSEVNTFLASLPNLGDALDIQTTTHYAGSNIAYIVTVTYVETP